MPIFDKTHLLPHKADRIKSLSKPQGRVAVRKYNELDNLIDEVYCDICNGVSRSDVLMKLMECGYKHQEKGVTKSTASRYYYIAMKRFAVNTDIEHKQLKDIFFSRYETILEECMKNGDMFNARATLDSMAKIFGVEQKTPETAIQINNSTDGVTINFGFDKTNED